MRCLNVLCFAAMALAGEQAAFHRETQAAMALHHLFGRQIQICGPGIDCADACGPGYIVCIGAPTCYNPSAGETCCSNGDYCPKGQYCTNAGCCLDGMSLEDCGATQTIATVAPPAPTSQSQSPPPASSAPQPVHTTPQPAPPPVYPTSSAAAQPSSPASNYTAAPAPQPTIAQGGAAAALSSAAGLVLSGIVAALLF
jgi:hypothetical protein